MERRRPSGSVDSGKSHGTEGKLKKLARAALVVLTAAVAGAYVIAGSRHPWDFETYYYAARALRGGLNPYSLEVLSEIARKPLELPFLYPPIALAVFLPFTWLPIGTAASVWLGLKCLLLGALIGVWQRDFLPEINRSTVVVIALLGFNLTALWDLRTGNVALLEAALLWLAFMSYVRGRDRLTVYWIAMGSMFKLLPILLVGLLGLVRRPGRQRLAMIVAGIAFLAVIVSLPPGLSSEWREALFRGRGDRPAGDVNPSALGVADWLVGALELPAAAAPNVALGFYLLFCAAVVTISIGPLLKLQAIGSRKDQVISVVLLWLLLSPRTMVYSYVMALVPVLCVIRSLNSPTARAAAYSLVVIQGVVRLLPGQPPEILAPLSFLIVLGAWIAWVGRWAEPPREASACT